MGDHTESLKISHIQIGALQVTDDLILLTSMPTGPQVLDAEAKVEASTQWFSFSKKKTRTMVISSKKKTNPRSCPDITLCGAKIGTSNVKYIMASQDSGKVATASKDKWREQVKKAVLSHWEKHWKMR